MTKKNTKMLRKFMNTLEKTRRFRIYPNGGDISIHPTDHHRMTLVAAMANFAGMSKSDIRTISKDDLNRYVAKSYGFLTSTVTNKLGYYNFNTKFPRQHASRFLNRYI